MNVALLPLVTALVAGFAHALEADHMAAVTAFVSRRPHPLRALGFGVRWAVGHSLAILLVGGALVLLDLRFTSTVEKGLEVAVGVMLFALGLWAFGSALHVRAYDDGHRHAHETGLPHSHAHGTTWVGMAHGLAGTSGFLALLPATLLASPWLAGGYVLLFAIGTVLSMGLYALVAGLLFHRVGERAPLLGRGLRLCAGVGTVVVGILWVRGAITGL
jgi:hypothetical protein